MPISEKMKIAIYAPGANPTVQLLTERIAKEISEIDCEIHVRKETLENRLRRLKRDIRATVFIVSGRVDLKGLLSVNRLLEGIPVLVMLPDSGKDIVALAHRFRPRFLTYLDDDLQNIIEVLRRIATRSRPERLRRDEILCRKKAGLSTTGPYCRGAG